jgi:hypothetical protein
MTIAMYSRTSWREVERNFTVGQMDGNFAGTIERRGKKFAATTGTGDQLGTFRSAASAERALERATEAAAGPSAVASTRHSLLSTSVLLASIAATAAVAISALVTL